MTAITTKAALLPAFEAKLVKLNRRAAKLGMTPVICSPTVRTVRARRVNTTYSVGMAEFGSYYDPSAFAAAPELSVPTAKDMVVDLVDIVIEGDAPKVEGYEFVATVDLRGSKPVVNRVPFDFDDVDLSAFYETDSHCDHCNSRRHRNDVLVLREAATGELIQIGRNCAADFFRSKEAQQMLAIYESVGGLGGNDEDFFSDRFPRQEVRVNLRALFTTAAAVVRTWGYVSVSTARADDDAVSTRSRVHDNLFPWIGMDPSRVVRPEAADEARADLILAWIEEAWVNAEATSDFERKVQAVIEHYEGRPDVKYVRARNLNMLIWMIDGYDAAMEKRERKVREQTVKAASVWVGEIGERVAMSLTLKLRRSFGSQWGTRNMCKFMDPEGNSVVWWANNGADEGIELEQTVVAKATVKDHGEYQGEKQTVVSRLKVEG